MTKQQKPKRRGRPAKFGPRRNFNFRLSEHLHKRLSDSAAREGRSLSEELELRVIRDIAWQDAKGDIYKMLAEAAAIRSAAHVYALRAAALSILREIDGRPTRAVVELERLLAEADSIARGLLGEGWMDDNAPPALPDRSWTAEEDQRALEKLEDLKRRLQAAAKVNKGNKVA